MIECLLPAQVASAETRHDVLDIELFPEEERAVAESVEKRRREFITGRALARQALETLGVPAAPIPSGARGEPVWPPGLVGSITHCRGYTACAVARAGDLLALGIDAEPNRTLPSALVGRVAFGRERELHSSDPSVHQMTLVFSAKEAVYKAWYPLTGRWLSFEQVRLSFERAAEFSAAPLVPAPVVEGVRLDELHGRWSLCDGVILTAVVVPRR